MDRVVVFGGGFAGLSAAIESAHLGNDVVLIEKHDKLGGRARRYTDSGFTFDMGPSWYWMPDVFENFFERYGYRQEDLYELTRLNPSYKVYWPDNTTTDVPADYQQLRALFEGWESGAGAALDKFLAQGETKYKTAFEEFIYKPGLSIFEFMNWKVISKLPHLNLLSPFSKHVNSFFSHPKIKRLVEFPVLFLGALPKNMPALYSLMTYADMKLGTFYPKGGMYDIVAAMEKVARDKGVRILLNEEIEKINYSGNLIESIVTSEGVHKGDKFINSMDYHHFEQNILDEEYRTYSKAQWQSRTMSPSAIIFYLGVDEKCADLEHHNLFFDTDFDKHASELYGEPVWPDDPLFYVCCPSKSDDSVSPPGQENLFVLIPVAPDLPVDQIQVERLFDNVIGRLSKYTGIDVAEQIVYRRDYTHQHFKEDYSAFKGNAYGLANTFNQTAMFKPSMLSKKIKNLAYCGQLTVPGPGVPPSLVSGQLAARLAKSHLSSYSKSRHEAEV